MNFHHYKVQLFYAIIDIQFEKLNNCFNKVNTKLLLCVTCLNFYDLFVSFNKQKLLWLTQIYVDGI